MVGSTASENCRVQSHPAYVYVKETLDSEGAASKMELVIAWFSIANHDQVRYPGAAWVVRMVVKPES